MYLGGSTNGAALKPVFFSCLISVTGTTGMSIFCQLHRVESLLPGPLFTYSTGPYAELD